MADDSKASTWSLPREARQAVPRTPAVPSHTAPAFEASEDDLEDSEDERTPISVTKPSFDLGAAGIPEPSAGAPHVAVMPAIDVGTEELLAPLPPPAVIAPEPSFGADVAPSSGPTSSGRVAVSVAPPMPQIPKPISSRRPVVQAPGIVSTQAFPLTLPAKRRGRSPLFVACTFALIGGMISLAVALWWQAKAPDRAPSPQEAPAATVTAPITSPPSPSATASEASPASAAAKATSAAAPPQARPSAVKPSAAPGSPARPGRKSDRIED